MATPTPFIVPEIGKELNLSLFDFGNMTEMDIKQLADAILQDARQKEPKLEKITTGPNAQGLSPKLEMRIPTGSYAGGGLIYLGMDACRCGGTCRVCRGGLYLPNKFSSLIEAIAKHPNIRILDLGALEPSEIIDFTPIARMLTTHPLLHTMVLWEGSINNEIGALLKKEIANNRTLKHLGLGRNNTLYIEDEFRTDKRGFWLTILKEHPTLEILSIAKKMIHSPYRQESVDGFLSVITQNQSFMLELRETPNARGEIGEDRDTIEVEKSVARVKPRIDAMNARNKDLRKIRQAFEMENIISSIQDTVYKDRKKVISHGDKEEIINTAPDFEAKAFMEIFSYLDEKPLKDKLLDYNAIGQIGDIEQFKEINSVVYRLGTLAKTEATEPRLLLQFKAKKGGKSSLIHSRTMTKEEMEFLIGFVPEKITADAILGILSYKDIPVVSVARQTSSSSREAASSATGWVLETTEDQMHKIHSILHSRAPKPTATVSGVTVTDTTIVTSGAGVTSPASDGPAAGTKAAEASTSDPEKEKMIRELEKRRLELMAKISSVRNSL